MAGGARYWRLVQRPAGFRCARSSAPGAETDLYASLAYDEVAADEVAAAQTH